MATLKTPLVWSLHMAYSLLALGLISMAVSLLNSAMNISNALHLITVGAIGGMILSMMSRVSLGHTGRALKVTTIIAVALFLIIAAAVIRFVLPLMGFAIAGWNISAALWIVAFCLFLWRYTPILLSVRTDSDQQ